MTGTWPSFENFGDRLNDCYQDKHNTISISDNIKWCTLCGCLFNDENKLLHASEIKKYLAWQHYLKSIHPDGDWYQQLLSCDNHKICLTCNGNKIIPHNRVFENGHSVGWIEKCADCKGTGIA